MLVNDPSQPLIESRVSVVHYDDDPAEIDKNLARRCGGCRGTGAVPFFLERELEGALQGRENEFARRKEKTLNVAAAVRNQAESYAASQLGKNSDCSGSRRRSPSRSSSGKHHHHRRSGSRVRLCQTILPARRPRSLLLLRRWSPWLGSRYGRWDAARVARSTRRCVLGDGARIVRHPRLWTAARRKLPVLVVVLDNRSYAAVVAALVDYKGEAFKRGVYPGCDVEGIDFTGPGVGFRRAGRSVAEHRRARASIAVRVGC